MAIDDEFNINRLKPYDFVEFFKTNNINKTMFLNKFEKISNSIIEALNKPELFNIDKEQQKIEFFNRYKNNTLKRIQKLKIVMHYINLPSSDKELDKFYNKNKVKIENTVDTEFLTTHSKSDIVDKFLS